jgi:hypothetical protein
MKRRALLLFALLAACGRGDVEPPALPAAGAEAEPHAGSDSAFAALQERGAGGMGVDQYQAEHHFDILPDGGRIELQYRSDDEAAIERIREHMQQIASDFSRGDFSTPAFVHMQDVPGTHVMAARRERIRYEYRPLPRGGEVRMTTGDAEALEALRSFIEFQRREHRAGGHGH